MHLRALQVTIKGSILTYCKPGGTLNDDGTNFSQRQVCQNCHGCVANAHPSLGNRNPCLTPDHQCTVQTLCRLLSFTLMDMAIALSTQRTWQESTLSSLCSYLVLTAH